MTHITIAASGTRTVLENVQLTMVKARPGLVSLIEIVRSNVSNGTELLYGPHTLLLDVI